MDAYTSTVKRYKYTIKKRIETFYCINLYTTMCSYTHERE